MSSPATLSIFNHLFASVAEEMGVTLERAAYSPNIKERLDFSCAVFLGDGRLLAQAAHIPVHIGAMPASVRAAISECAPFAPGDVVILNDPYLGGNHLPDVTMVSPVFVGTGDEGLGTRDDSPVLQSLVPSRQSSETAKAATTSLVPSFFVASRAHHADVGGMSPGSMPLSTEIYQEGVIIPPLKLVAGGVKNTAVWRLILRNVRTPEEREGDLAAQLAAHAIGEKRLAELVERYGLAEVNQQGEALLAYASRLTAAAISAMPDGRYPFTDYLDDDGQGQSDIPIAVALTVAGEHLTVDFAGTAEAVRGNLNTVPAVVESAVAYGVRCMALAMLGADLPMNEGAYAPITVIIPEGCLLNPRPPHAVAAGNVETSQRITDVVLGALALALPALMPAASQGTMNNFTFGGRGLDGRPFAFCLLRDDGGRHWGGADGRWRGWLARAHEQHAEHAD
ncbi:MAG: hydantoinase B/oxoprolinase family protein [Chloroflexi bacterium]|nr:hydantoinase B/oxoprolinase family protein [Chloroflexota bacterium]